MAITIKQNGETWRVLIENEEWNFNDRKDLDENLKKILDIKEKKGRLIK
jgi:hypothetical protein